jgi:HEAT repeat protein
MRWTPTVLPAAFCWVFVLIVSVPAAEFDTVKADEDLLRDAKLANDGPALLEFFRQRTLTGANRAKIQGLVQRLGDRSFRVREKAQAELIRMGTIATALLRQAVKDADPEVQRRAAHCLQEIEKGTGRALASAAARLIAVRKPPGAAEALLDYLPAVADESGAEEVVTALAAVARSDGKTDPAVIRALGDPIAVRRAAAAESLCRAGATEELPAVRKLLTDRDPAVRMRVALALVYARDKSAFPVLIDLLGELPRDRAWQIEDVLQRLAESQTPAWIAGTDDVARRQWRDAWAAWWQKHQAQVDLAKLQRSPALLGYTVVVLLDSGQVMELGTDRKPRWQIGGLQSPLDAQVLPGERVVIAEYTPGRVTERDRKGEVLWEKQIPNPTAAQRLPNGHTFIVTPTQLLVVDRAGKEVYTFAQPGISITAGRKFPDGRIGYVTGNRYVELDAGGKELKSFAVGNAQTTSSLDVLVNGHIVIGQYGDGKVVEFDRDGKAVWQAAVSSPISVVRLPSGNTLVTSQHPQQVIELDRDGKTVWDYQATGHPTRARRR